VDCNEATLEMLGYRSKSDLLRVHPSELSPKTQPDGRDSFEKANEMMALAWARGSHRFEWEHLRVTGEPFPVEVLLTAVEEGGRRMLHVVWRDVTDRKRMEERLRHTQKMEIVGQLAGGIAHDFNNLLVAILGNGELLQKKLTENPELRVYVEEMLKAGQRGAALVRQLLLFSRPYDTPLEVIDLVTVLVDVRRMLERLIGEDMALVTDFCDGPLPVQSTRSHVEQVVMNLVTNARDAMPQGGTIRVGLKRTIVMNDSIGAVDELSPGAYAEVSVTDSGHGMDEEVRARAIHPFFTTKEVGRGTGLGLSTVYGIAKQSGGGLRIDSVVGRGTSVRVYLPLRPGVGVARDSERAEAPPAGGTERILVVEDDVIVGRVVVRVLEAQGYRVELARDGREALELFEPGESGHALVVSDVVMPNMNGPELLRELRTRGLHPRVLFMSGYTRDLALGDSPDPTPRVLEKPFSPNALLALVRELLDRRA